MIISLPSSHYLRQSRWFQGDGAPATETRHAAAAEVHGMTEVRL